MENNKSKLGKENALLFGAAYYYEYLPEERLEKDMEMMKAAGFNVIRIAESTWSTWEPAESEFDFSSLHRVLRAATKYGLQVIIGTPTYALPTWLAAKYPDLLAETHGGRQLYGPRQNFDITHPGYRYYAERIIRWLLAEVKGYDCVIGFQLDNETKPYDICSERVQLMFRDWLKKRFGTVEALNSEMGLAFWSNRVESWETFPDIRGTINGSLGAEFEAFQRHLVTEFLQWQREIVDEYRRKDQFVTHNFDYEWRGYSFGLQPEVDQFEAADAVTVAGCDIYHPSESELTGAEIAFGGAIARGLKKDNYLVLETQAQGNYGWLPYPGQLRLQAFSHLASGAAGVEYWHWHSNHNGLESYWKGVLSHDFSAGAVYEEAASIGRDFQRFSPHLMHLQKKNKVAVMVSNRSQTGMKWFPTCQQGFTPDKNYSDYLRWICDSLYRLNVEYDVIPDTQVDFLDYDVLILPCLYSAPDVLLRAVELYVKYGGHLITTFKTGFADECIKIRHDRQPYGLVDCLGVGYDRFTRPVNVGLSSDSLTFPNSPRVTDWMELLEPVGNPEILCTYDHPAWKGTPAVTLNHYGWGQAVYLGCCFDGDSLDVIMETVLERFGLSLLPVRFPVIIKSGRNEKGQMITWYLNYSGEIQRVQVSHGEGYSLEDGKRFKKNEEFTLKPWGFLLLVSEDK